MWGPAYGRLYTSIHYYREGLTTPEERIRWLPFNRDALQGRAPYTGPPPTWRLMLFLKSNYPEMNRIRPGALPYQRLTDAELDQIVRRYRQQWLPVAMSRNNRASLHSIWNFVNYWESRRFFHRDPLSYFRVGADVVRALPIGRWLAEAGITPTDDRGRPYHRRLIEAALTTHLGGGIHLGRRHFQLYCADLNIAEAQITNNEPPEIRMRYMRLDHPRPPSMLLAIVICTSPHRSGPGDDIFVPCPVQMPLYDPPSSMMYVLCPEEQEELFLYRTINDGIDTPFVEDQEVNQEEEEEGEDQDVDLEEEDEGEDPRIVWGGGPHEE